MKKLPDGWLNEYTKTTGDLINLLRAALGKTKWREFVSVSKSIHHGMRYYSTAGLHLGKPVIAVCSHDLLVAVKSVTFDRSANQGVDPREMEHYSMSLKNVINPDYHHELLQTVIIEENIT